MALGCLFEGHDEASREASILEGTGYFETCRGLVDLQDCNDLVTLQAILYMNIFLLYTARVSSCFSALSYTFSLALRMKYHQIIDTDNEITREDKRHVFWTTRHLLACVAIAGGLPMPIGGDDLDFDYPNVEGVRGMHHKGPLSENPHNTVQWSPTVASVACFRLHDILGHVTKRLYPSKGAKKTQGQGPLRHLVSMDTVRELEGELRSWLASLPPSCRLGQERHPQHIERAKYELCMSYAHAQIYLYRPFLHYLDPALADGTGAADGFPGYASACVDASRNIIRLAQDMCHRELLRGAQWDISIMILASSLTMLYIILAKKGSTVEEMALRELATARSLMTLLEPYTMLSKRLSVAVKLLTTTILPDGMSSASPLIMVHSPSTQVSYRVDDSYTATLAEKAFGLSKTNEPGHPEMLSLGRQREPALFPPATERQSANIPSQRSTGIAIQGESTSQNAPALAEAQNSGPSDLPFTMLSARNMYNTPLFSGDAVENSPVLQYGINTDDYGYMIDGTGPIDFSDMIGDLFTSEGLL
ncbi:fungal specific transcription factor domain-containing protein [Aspergillus alliaceus]|uniref:fungal specific transcription factor domain-containing protein n=1 Tax=Petromyces alliaceus TaxID=209559 RepID=UPI0012A6FA3F|nr:uncharacterized protein BDW43DRAFT_303611 [Aspergillus alliaceus]KAB8228801.1 hypothetical protein BDW43DRAFT_303611 [Aspergillus alliaceus]